MRQFTVQPRYNQKRIDTFLFEMLPGVNASVIYKAFRKRSIKVNQKRVKESHLLASGDIVEVYIPDEYLKTSPNKAAGKLPSVVYEDDYIIAVSKPQGIPVHRDKNQDQIVLDEWVQDYVRKRNEANYEKDFPALCHRIDRNTGGLVLLSKDAKTLDIMQEKFKNHEIAKTYICVVLGTPEKKSGTLEGYLKKDSSKSRVFIYDHPVKNADRIITRYRVKKYLGKFSLLEVELVTGKTHQIRAHLAHIGCPLLGDGKYGKNEVNKALGLKWQALWAVKVGFPFSSPSGHLEYLKNKTIALPEISWEEGIKNLGISDDEHLIQV